jgi:hypothetical protein
MLLIRQCLRKNYKGIVQRDLPEVETRLKQSVLLSYSVSKFFLFYLTGTIMRKA